MLSQPELCAVFSAYRVIETGISHGTLSVLLEGQTLEITTFRTEVGYSDGRHPDQVHFAASLGEDLARRDFTINAMAYHPKTGLVDLFGGRQDLEMGQIRCVGDADARFGEDALRILRALRFASVLGFAIEEDTERALRRHGGGTEADICRADSRGTGETALWKKRGALSYYATLMSLARCFPSFCR